MRHTVADVAEKLRVDKELARGLVKLLVHLELATPRGERRPESGRGRAEDVFEFEEGYEKELLRFLVEAELSA
jgi:hypothetical protein